FPVALAVFVLSVVRLGSAAEVRLAIGGYDPVAYFTDGKPVPGSGDNDYFWHDARWRFASTEHRDMLARDPERYAPQYDGYCAMGVSREKDTHKDIPDPHAWAIVDGKLYLTHNQEALARWQQNPAENIRRADLNWPKLKDDQTVYDGFPNLATK
ncbi:MAG: YHS domain-containing (seleno)protein, partial [Alphaproteobacteria bacterium]